MPPLESPLCSYMWVPKGRSPKLRRELSANNRLPEATAKCKTHCDQTPAQRYLGRLDRWRGQLSRQEAASSSTQSCRPTRLPIRVPSAPPFVRERNRALSPPTRSAREFASPAEPVVSR